MTLDDLTFDGYYHITNDLNWNEIMLSVERESGRTPRPDPDVNWDQTDSASQTKVDYIPVSGSIWD